MRSKALATLLSIFLPALPGYRYQFPADYFNHPEYRTEWWYYTGNVHTIEGHRFGFELTFFRQGIGRESPQSNIWDARDVWLAHLALSDLDGKQFFHTERLNRAGPGLAGASLSLARVWNGNWQVQWLIDPKAPGGVTSERLQAVADQFSFDLTLRPAKPVVVHGVDGVSQKSEGAGHASHYFSQTRLNTQGTLTVAGQSFQVDGWAWMDHEFFSHEMASNQRGWDWFSMQFDDGSELMLYRLRRKDGSSDPYSAGTFVDPLGHATHLTQFSLLPGETWTSPVNGAGYPIEWTIRVPSLTLDLHLSTRLPQQELTGGTSIAPTYWEGAIEVSGSKQGHPVRGAGYLEMTGYAGAIRFGGTL